MVMIDKLRKVAHLVVENSTNSANEVAQIFKKEIMRLHGIPMKIILDKYGKFNSWFRKELFKDLVRTLPFKIANYPQKNGKTKRKNRILEDMLRMYVMF